jgi:hypothetical protein
MKVLARLAFALIASIAAGPVSTIVKAQQDGYDIANVDPQAVSDGGKESLVLSERQGSLRGLQGPAEVMDDESFSRQLQSKLGEWAFCSASSQCANGCCSKKYSNDGRLKCTPVGGFKTSEGCVGSGSGTPS